MITTMIASTSVGETRNFMPKRISKTATIVLNGSVENVFPLFGPIKEMEWAPGWNPEVVYSDNNVVEEHMIFRSKGKYENEDYYTWIISQYYPEKYLIEYTVSTADRIWTIRVACASFDKKTKATVAYTYTGLTERGNSLNELALNQMYASNLTDWQEALNYYLETGKAIAN